MRISPINFRTSVSSAYHFAADKHDDIHTTVRKNALSDMEFNIIADAIRSQNLKNQMDVRLRHLKQNLNSNAAKDMYKEV